MIAHKATGFLGNTIALTAVLMFVPAGTVAARNAGQALVRAAKEGKVSVARQLLKKGADPIATFISGQVLNLRVALDLFHLS